MIFLYKKHLESYNVFYTRPNDAKGVNEKTENNQKNVSEFR